jgi:phospholipid-binding lipoprotein MlaA
MAVPRRLAYHGATLRRTCLPMLMRTRHALVVLLLALFAGAGQAADPRDPWEGFNRRVYAFNDFLDTWFLKPVARGYRYVTPEPVDRSVSHVFDNLREVGAVPNFLLQGDLRHAGNAFGRVMANTTFGVAGIFDVASATGIARKPTDFGITLGKWGLGSGPYLVLPFLGSSTLRDAAGVPVDMVVEPLPEPWTLVEHDLTRWSAVAVNVIDIRADLLDYEEAMIGDRYGFLRDVYLQRRDFEVSGEQAADPFLDEEF